MLFSSNLRLAGPDPQITRDLHTGGFVPRVAASDLALGGRERRSEGLRVFLAAAKAGPTAAV